MTNSYIRVVLHSKTLLNNFFTKFRQSSEENITKNFVYNIQCSGSVGDNLKKHPNIQNKIFKNTERSLLI